MFRNASPAPERVVRVKVMVDSRLMVENRAWKDAVTTLVTRASEYYEDHFAIRLAITAMEEWVYAGETPFTSDLMVDLKSRLPLDGADPSYDLILGLTRQRISVYFGRGRADRIGSCEEGLGRHVVVFMSVPLYRNQDDLDTDATAVIHEIGHIFGAEHADDPDSIMNEHFRYRTEFDRLNREILLRNRLCPFG